MKRIRGIVVKAKQGKNQKRIEPKTIREKSELDQISKDKTGRNITRWLIRLRQSSRAAGAISSSGKIKMRARLVSLAQGLRAIVKFRGGGRLQGYESLCSHKQVMTCLRVRNNVNRETVLDKQA